MEWVGSWLDGFVVFDCKGTGLSAVVRFTTVRGTEGAAKVGLMDFAMSARGEVFSLSDSSPSESEAPWSEESEFIEVPLLAADSDRAFLSGRDFALTTMLPLVEEFDSVGGCVCGMRGPSLMG